MKDNNLTYPFYKKSSFYIINMAIKRSYEVLSDKNNLTIHIKFYVKLVFFRLSCNTLSI
jgi:hypothetical protein